MSKASVQHVKENYSRKNFDRTVHNIIYDVIRCRDGNHTGVEVNYTPKLYFQKSNFPHVERPWESYIDCIKHYVSHELPILNENTLFRPFASTRAIDNCHYYLDDPAWPATVQLSNDEVHLLNSCYDNDTPLLEKYPSKHAEIRRLVEEGILIPHLSRCTFDGTCNE